MFSRKRKDDSPWPAEPVRTRPARDTAAQIQALVDGCQRTAGPPADSWRFTAEVVEVRGNRQAGYEPEI